MRGIKTAAVAAILWGVPTQAEVVDLNIPAGALRDVVASMSMRARVSISVADPAIWRKTVPALRGRMSVDAALDKLLAGSGARATRVGASAWRIDMAFGAHEVDVAPPPAILSVAPSSGEEDVVVIGRRGSSVSRMFPGIVVRLGADQIRRDAKDGTEALLMRTATLSSTHLGKGRNKLFIRGIADSSLTGPTQSTVGQYWGNARLGYNAPDPDLELYDIEAVEIYEGLQGTLFGAGSFGGVVRVVPKSPRLDAPEALGELGTSATWHGEPSLDAAGAISLPIVPDQIGFRLVGYGAREGGYIDDSLRNRSDVNRTEVIGGRAALRLAPADSWTISLSAITQKTNGYDSQYSEKGGARLTRESLLAEGFSTNYRLVEATVEGSLENLRLTTSTGIAHQHVTERFDASLPDLQVRLFSRKNETSMSFHETRLARVAKDGGEWMVGLSLLHNSTRQRQTIEALLRPASTSRIINIVAEQTMFGEVGVSLARNLLLKVGGRLSRARLSGGGADTIGEHLANESHPVARHTTTTALPSFALTWEAGRHTTLFARVQKGHRPGGVALETNVVRSYDSDSLTTWEAGLRYGAEGQAPIHLTLSAVASRWRDIQADFIDAGGRSSTSNIGDGRLYSISSSASWSPYPGLNLDAGVVLNSSKVVPADEALITLFPVGPPSKIPNIANATAHVALGHEAMISDDLRLTISGHARYVGSSRLGVGRSLGARQGSYLDTRLLARVQRGSLGLTVGISNLLDAVGNRFALGTPFQSAQSEQITPLRPRTVRMSLDLDF